ncbi:putative deoxyribonuclease RhsC [Andreprevotia sp. IGB-42]|uniref:RHS repeat-associated core domain-containing protein n=1 Tax=Andreprevotia sp. IGB-42 TaxID=2497473 RepID=UPI00135B954A|nr:RHS repeat-associated core domain-containing protein [Andreprevotia sp. IGB-42]KAF0812123.1 putative deoxyribonuclease RhsC [Andreprevotia sp. IGB-42]
MSDLCAARLGDPIVHTSLLGDILKVALDIAAYALITAAAVAAVAAAAAATGLTLGAGAPLLIGVVVGIGMGVSGGSGLLDKATTGIANFICPPQEDGKILTGSTNTFTNSKPAARAAGKVGGGPASPPPAPSLGDEVVGFLSDMWRPTIAVAAPGSSPVPLDTVLCGKHPPAPPAFLAQGSESVFINSQPATRKGDKTTCGADVGTASKNVFIGGQTITVRDVKSGANPWVGAIATVALLLTGKVKGSFCTKLLCMGGSFVVGVATAYVTQRAVTAINNFRQGSPVHVLSGAKVLDAEDDLDFSLPGRMPITWQRVYNSRNLSSTGLFGQGWSCDYAQQISTDLRPDGVHYHLQLDDGQVLSVPPMAAGESYHVVDLGLRVGRTEGDHLIVEIIDAGIYYLFGKLDHLAAVQNQPLRGIEDRHGNRLTLRHDEHGRLYQMINCSGVLVELSYDPQHPQRVAKMERLYLNQAPERETLVEYAYDARGQLIEVRDSAGQSVRRFAYDNNSLMVEQALRTGLICHYEWQQVQDAQGVFPRVVRHTNSLGQLWQFAYDGEQGITRCTDQLGRTQTWTWDALYQVLSHTDALGRTTLCEWTEQRMPAAIEGPDGGRDTASYDDAGNVVALTDPLGRSYTFSWHPQWLQVVNMVEPGGQAWQFEYDNEGQRVRTTDPLGHVTLENYDDHGQLIKITDPRGGQNLLVWNGMGQLIQETDCSGKSSYFYYDVHGLPIRTVNAIGNETSFNWDAVGQLKQLQLADGSQQQFHWSTEGWLAAETDALGQITRYERDPLGRLARKTDPLHGTLAFEYDRAGNLAQLRNQNQQSYGFNYDAADQCTAEISLDGRRREYGLDINGNTVEVREAAGSVHQIVTELQRDIMGRLVAKITAETVTRYSWDANDQVIQVARWARDDTAEQQQGAFIDQIDWAYDPLGSLLSETTKRLRASPYPGQPAQEDVQTLQHEYDVLGNRIATTLPDGRRLQWLSYGSGHVHQIMLDGEIMCDMDRDDLHREIARSQGLLNSAFEYDAVGRQTRHWAFKPGQQWPWPQAREEIRQRSLHPRVGDALAKHFEYGPTGELTRRQDTINGEALFSYDAIGRLREARSSVVNEHFAYDAASNMLDPVRTGQAQAALLHNRISVHEDKRFAYDAHGRLAEKRIGAHTIQTFRYNCEHQLIEVAILKHGQQSSVRFEYDALGRRTAKHSGNSSTRFGWDGMQMILEDSHSSHTLYLYEPGSYTPLARVDRRPDAANDDATVYWFHANPTGAPEELTDRNGRVVWQARYQSWGNLALEQQPADEYAVTKLQNDLRYPGQYHDRETGLHYNTFRYYDPDIGRFTTEDPIGLNGGLNLYQYGPNPFAWIDPWGWVCKSAFSGNRGRNKAMHDLKRNGFKLVAEEVTMKVNGKRIRADFVMQDQQGKYHVFEVKHGSGGLTKNQKAAGVFDMKSPANTTKNLGGGTIKPSQGKQGVFKVATRGQPGKELGGFGAQHDATFNLLIYK